LLFCYKEKGDGFNLKEESKMPTVKIDEKEYELDLLSSQAKEQLMSLQFVDAELQRLQSQTAVLQTARMAYAKALNDALPATVDMSEVIIGNVK
jgi:hypothetical protein